jgi:ribonucleotide reductase beta subunit family protein with ferritin-like domain
LTEVHLYEPQTLYRHWEEGQWNPFAIDLDADRIQWRDLAGEDRALIFWVLSSLMVAEERITTKFSGLLGAYATERGGGDLPRDPAGRRGAPHAVLCALPG